ncbi:FtsK/SpoIIIE domain-containing protein [Lactococcus allomyrinae]|uniref:Cell division protein FtsK n=1 Tax=Lactococcus allomyrinae TaxID=2419773 RepID=A0A387BGB0_9LACT|nr:FtsK/SpoIIIE domain-containing protein [Lactococcus allomyrinae]AYG01324.1 cell division protein FtsK [Lactococcus allomyrinae]
MKHWFNYRGFRIRLFKRYLLRNWGLGLSVPFLIALAYYHFIITYPFFRKINRWNEWTVYLQPVLVSLFVMGLAIAFSFFVIRRSELKDGFFMRRKKMEMLARYMFSNNIIERKQIKTEKGTREKLSFPKAYYRSFGDRDVFTFATGNQFHNQVISIGKTLSEMYLADLTKINWEMGYISYEFLMNNQGKRINFEQVSAENGKITLMQGIVWEYDKLPHMLIMGGTGGGKTFFIYALLYALTKEGRVHLADPKKADLAEFASFKAFKGLVTHEKADIISMMEEAEQLMDKRFLYMKRQKNYTIGKNYRYYNMAPEFIVVDELAAFVSTLKSMEYEEFFNYVISLVLKARQAGVFVIFATQRPDVNTLPGAVRDNLMCRVTAGRVSPTGYDMAFPDSKDKAFVNKDIVGRGYIDIGSGIPIEFFTPLVSKDFDFVDYFQKLPSMPFTDVSDIELTAEAKQEVSAFYDDMEDFETAFVENAKTEIIQTEAKKKEENIEKLMEKANVPTSYREKLNQGN